MSYWHAQNGHCKLLPSDHFRCCLRLRLRISLRLALSSAALISFGSLCFHCAFLTFDLSAIFGCPCLLGLLLAYFFLAPCFLLSPCSPWSLKKTSNVGLVKYWHRELFNFSSDHLGSMRHVSLRFLCELCFGTSKNWHPAEFEFAFAASFGLGACQLHLLQHLEALSGLSALSPYLHCRARKKRQHVFLAGPLHEPHRDIQTPHLRPAMPLCFTLSPPELPFPWPWAGPWVPASSAPPDRSNWI